MDFARQLLGVGNIQTSCEILLNASCKKFHLCSKFGCVSGGFLSLKVEINEIATMHSLAESERKSRITAAGLEESNQFCC